MRIKLEKNGGSYGVASVKINGKIYGPADRTPSGLTAAAIVADWATSASAADYAEARRWLAQWPEGPQLKGAQQAAAGSQGGKAKTAAKSTAAKANGAKGGAIPRFAAELAERIEDAIQQYARDAELPADHIRHPGELSRDEYVREDVHCIPESWAKLSWPYLKAVYARYCREQSRENKLKAFLSE